MKLRILFGLVALSLVSLPTTVDALVLGTKNFSNSGTNHDRDFAYMEFYFAYTTPSVAYIFDEVQLDGDEAGDIYTSDASNPDFSTYADLLTDGVGTQLEFWWRYDTGGGGGIGQPDAAGYWSGTPPGGLVGATVDAVEFEVNSMIIDDRDWAYNIDVRVLGTPAAAPVPEPCTILLLGTGLVGLVGFRKKFKK